jgi:hypothetical protein
MQEAQKAKDDRLEKLEATIEEMSSVFLDLSDYIISSEACRKDSGTLNKLQAATRQVLDLARPVNDTAIGKATSGGEHDRNIPSADLLLRQESMDQPCSNDVIDASELDWSRIALLQKDPLSGPITDQPPFSAYKDISQPDVDASISPGIDLGSIRNVLGNGWLGQVPKILTVTSPMLESPATAVGLQSTGFRLLQSLCSSWRGEH